jgi:hypothetical protein
MLPPAISSPRTSRELLRTPQLVEKVGVGVVGSVGEDQNT